MLLVTVEEGEISFNPGEQITRIEQFDQGWWRGVAPNGQYGLFPSNYVKLNTLQHSSLSVGFCATAVYDFQAGA